MQAILRMLPLFVVLVFLSVAHAESIPPGQGQLSIDIDGRALELFTYRPANFHNGPLIVACHGVLRNAEEYRTFAQGLADQLGALVVAPRFDDEQFPQEAYQFGGILKDGQLQSADDWTVSLVPKIVDCVRRQEGRVELPCYLLGHSAGGQFLARLAGMTASQAELIVVANPGTHLFPTREMPFPYGFGGLPDDLSDDLVLKRYLAQPMIIYLGTADVESEYLPTGEFAQGQGANRYERGRNCYRAAAELAAARGWTLNWKLVEAPAVGHDAEAMFRHARIAVAVRASECVDSAMEEIFVDEGEMFDDDELEG
jgi:poly(3-hydroxybutyrate) depolymerase